MKMLIQYFLLTLVIPTLHAHSFLPESSYCVAATWCQLVNGDISRENGKFDEKFYDQAVEISEKYLQPPPPDYKKINKLLLEEGISKDSPHGTASTNFKKLAAELKAINITLTVNSTKDREMSVIRLNKMAPCTGLYKDCTSEMKKLLSTSKLTPKLKACPWQSYPYMWFRCLTLKNWPAEVTRYLHQNQLKCHMLPECSEFQEWENLKKAALPLDWDARKSNNFGVMKGRAMSNNDKAEPKIVKETMNIIRSASNFAENQYSNWTDCPNGTFANGFRIIEAVNGLAGISLFCGLPKENHTLPEISIIAPPTPDEEYVHRPVQNCSGLLTGFELLVFKDGTWTFFTEDIAANCQTTDVKLLPADLALSDVTTTVPLKCPSGSAVCSVRVSLQKPEFRTYDRIFDLQLYCCEVALTCNGSQSFVRIASFDRTDDKEDMNHTLVIQKGIRTVPGAYSYGHSEVAIQTALKAELGKLGYDTFDPFTNTSLPIVATGGFVTLYYQLWATCGDYQVAKSIDHVRITAISASKCTPSVREEFTSEAFGIVNPQFTLRGHNATTGLLANFARNNISIELSTEAYKGGVGVQRVGTCRNKLTGGSYKVYDKNIKPYTFPNSVVCEPYSVYWTLGVDLTNENFPSEVEIYHELKVGIDWKDRPAGKGVAAQFRILSDNLKQRWTLNEGKGDQFKNIALTGLDWRQFNGTWPLYGINKKSFRVKLGVGQSIRFYQLIGKCREYIVYKELLLYKILDEHKKCIKGSFPNGENGCAEFKEVHDFETYFST